MNAGKPGGKNVCNVATTVNDGSTYRSGTESGGIDFGQAWNETKVKDKLRWLAGQVLSKGRVAEVLNLVDGFDESSNVSALTELVNQDT